MADCGLSPFGSTTHLGTAFHSCFAAGIFTPLVTHVQQTQLHPIHLVLTSNPYMSSELGSPFLRMLCSPPSFEVYEPCGVANRSAHRTLSTVLALASTKQHAFVAHQEKHDAIPVRRAGRLQVLENGPLLGGTDNLRLLALHGRLLIALVCPLIRKISVKRIMLLLCRHVKGYWLPDPPHGSTAPQRFLCGSVLWWGGVGRRFALTRRLTDSIILLC